jgi:hypothetical protein
LVFKKSVFLSPGFFRFLLEKGGQHFENTTFFNDISSDWTRKNSRGEGSLYILSLTGQKRRTLFVLPIFNAYGHIVRNGGRGH